MSTITTAIDNAIEPKINGLEMVEPEPQFGDGDEIEDEDENE
jgi:hypothetical protein